MNQATPPDSPTHRVLRAIPSYPFILDVPSERPYPNRPDQVAYEYARMAGATFRTRDDESNELHLQHMSFLKRDVNGTLLTQQPLTQEAHHQTAEPPTKRLKLDHDTRPATPSTPTRKKLTLQDYKNKSAARSTPLAASTPPPSQPATASPPRSHPVPEHSPEPALPSPRTRLKALSPTHLLRSAAASMASLDNWPIPLPRASQAPKPTPNPPKPRKALSDRLQDTGKTLKRSYEDLNKTLESETDPAGRAQLEKRSLATAVESVICFMRSFSEREKSGEAAKRLWSTLYPMLNLVAHRARKEEDVAGVVALLDGAVSQRALMAMGSVKWEDMRDEKARKEGWEGVQKAVARAAKAQQRTLSWTKLKMHHEVSRDVADLKVGGLGNIECVCRVAVNVLEGWAENEKVEWKRMCRE